MNYNCQKLTEIIKTLHKSFGIFEQHMEDKKYSEAREIQHGIDLSLTNIKETLFANIYKEWNHYSDGQIILQSDKSAPIWSSHPDGILNWHDTSHTLYLNNRAIHFENEYYYNWKSHPQGYMHKSQDGHFNEYLTLFPVDVNRKPETVYESKYSKEYFDWSPHPFGFVVQKGRMIYLNGRTLKCELPEWDTQWKWHPDGVIVEEKDEWNNQMVLKVNNQKIVYKGPVTDWCEHPKGFLIARGDDIYLNNKDLLYHKEPNDKATILDFTWHPDGVIVRQTAGSRKFQWIFYNGREASK